VAMDECALARMCPMEESWDKDVWADGWSTCESENELCITLIGKDSGHTPPSLDMDSVCHSTAWSTCDSPGSTCPPASQSGEELTLQDDSKAHKKKNSSMQREEEPVSKVRRQVEVTDDSRRYRLQA